MTDQEWGNVDGSAGGAASAAAGGAGRSVEGAAAPNVVPFPRDWFGSVDDLVPIEVDAPQTSPAEAAAAPDRATLTGLTPAASFWGGEVGVAEEAPAGVGQEALQTDRERRHEPAAAAAEGAAGAAAGRARAGTGLPRASRRAAQGSRGRAVRPALVGTLLLLVAAGLLALAPGALTGQGHVGRRRALTADRASAGPMVRTVTETVTTSVRTNTRAVRRPRHRADRVRRAAEIQAASSTSPSSTPASSAPVSAMPDQPEASGVPATATRPPAATAGTPVAADSTGDCTESPDSGCMP